MFAIFNDYIKLHGFKRFIWESFLYFWCNWTCSGKSPTLQSSMQKLTRVMRNQKRWVNLGFWQEQKKHQLPFPPSSQSLVDWKRCRFSAQILRWMVPEGSMVKVAASIPNWHLCITWAAFYQEKWCGRIQDDEIFFTWFWYSNKSKRWWFSILKLRSKRVKWASGWGLRTSHLTCVNNKICIYIYI